MWATSSRRTGVPDHARIEVTETRWTPDLDKDSAARLLALLFRPAPGERKDIEREDSREGEAA
jgi:hypothetical protein